MWIKICGITNREDALAAIDAGADALGFNLWPGSKRFLPLEENASWIRELSPRVERIAVLVNATLPEAIRVAAEPGIDAVQFHGDETPEYLAEFATSGRSFIVARRLAESTDPSSEPATTDRILIDANVPGAFGGTGVAVDLDLAASYVRLHPDRKVILAGGLTPANVAEAVRRVDPYGIDVATGVERDPRKKDPDKVRALVAAVRSDL